MQDQNPQDPSNQNATQTGQPAAHPPSMMSDMGDNTSPGEHQIPAQPAAEPEDTTPANFQLGAMLPAELKVTIPAHELKFDEKHFLTLLAGSISLSRDEKKRIIETIPKLKQAQVDELVRIFDEERYKFSQLSKKHIPQLEKLAKQHYQDWMDLEVSFHAEEKKAADNSAADEIRKSLGL